MAHKKGQGSSRNGRNSNPQMLGIKLFGGQVAKPGSILCRQKGTQWRPGKNVGVGRDWTIFSLIEGKVSFDRTAGGSTCCRWRKPRPRTEESHFTVSINCVLSEYIKGALDRAEFEKLEDGSYSGSIPICPGVIAFAGSLRVGTECVRSLKIGCSWD